MTDVTNSDLLRVKAWARKVIQNGQEPPWSWYEHMKLIDAIDGVLNKDKTTVPPEYVTGPRPFAVSGDDLAKAGPPPGNVVQLGEHPKDDR